MDGWTVGWMDGWTDGWMDFYQFPWKWMEVDGMFDKLVAFDFHM